MDAPLHLQYNYEGFGTDKMPATSAASVTSNVLAKEEIIALQQKLTKLCLDTNGVDAVYVKGKTNAVMILQRRTGLVIDGIAGPQTLVKIEHLLKEKGLIGTPGIFRVVTRTFGTLKAAVAAAKETGFGDRVYTGIFTSLSLLRQPGHLLKWNMAITQESNRTARVHNDISPGFNWR